MKTNSCHPSGFVHCPSNTKNIPLCWAASSPRELRARQVADRYVRRKFQSARDLVPDERKRRSVDGAVSKFQSDECWRDLILFYEYCHGDTGTGMGASHHTGWTALVTKLIQQSGASERNLADTVGIAAGD
jgi:hypothetical protein